MPDAVTIPDSNTTASLTAVGTVAIVCESFNSVNISLTGTWVATVFFEGSPDGTNWYQVQALDGNGNSFNNVAAVGQWVVNCGGFHQIRARVGSFTSGTVVIFLNASFGVAIPNITVQTIARPILGLSGGTGNLTANGQSSGPQTYGCAAAVFQISGTWVGTLQFQGTEDGATFVPIPAVRLDTNPTFGRDVQYTTTVNGTYIVSCGGMSSVICKFTAFTSGTAVVASGASVGGGPVYPLPANRGRNLKCIATAATFRTIGNNASPEIILTLENGTSSAVLVALRELTLAFESGAAFGGTVIARAARTTALPTGGTTLSKVLLDTSLSSDANVVARGSCSVDAGAITTPTATASTTLAQGFMAHPITLVGVFGGDEVSLLPAFATGGGNDPFILRAGEAILVECVHNLGGNNVNTCQYLAVAVWDEFVYG